MNSTIPAMRQLGITDEQMNAVINSMAVNIDDIWSLFAKYKDRFVDPRQAISDLVDLATNFSFVKLATFFAIHGKELITDATVMAQFVQDLIALLRPHVATAAAQIQSFHACFSPSR